ncbi:MAG: hypothetical protein U9R06_00350 [Patescibacteria group bacterium]|nr:hypothetical protein [Patescibacteria group bacterium]
MTEENISKDKFGKSINRAIMEVVVFFDLFDYPLTKFEIWQYLGAKCDLKSVAVELRKAALLGKKHGFYFLCGREKIVRLRLERYNFTNQKIKRALRVARLFKFIPWIKLIAVGNMIGGNNLKKSSDIDLFIVTSQKRIWITRFFCVGLAKSLRLRPTPANKQDKICLSFYIAEDAMDMRRLMLNNKKEDDPYFVYWAAGLTPIYNQGLVYEKFIQANKWLFECLPNWSPVKTVKIRDAGSGFNHLYRDTADLLIGGLESAAKNWQLKIMPKKLKSVMNEGTNVVVSDNVLKLYATDKREKYREKFLKKIKGLNILA